MRVRVIEKSGVAGYNPDTRRYFNWTYGDEFDLTGSLLQSELESGHLERVQESVEVPTPSSVSQPEAESIVETATAVADQPKRRRGRPKGSKNKPKADA